MFEEALQFFRAYELWIYLLLALGGLIYVRKFILAWEDMRAAAFGLERESAQGRLNQAAGMFVLILMLAIAEFSMVTFVAPAFPGSSPLGTPTLDLLATATSTLPSTEAQEGVSTPGTPTAILPRSEGCVPGQVMISEPLDGAEVTGLIGLKGTANIPNFGFYKYEVARPDDDVWMTIQAGRDVKLDTDLGQWDTRTLPSGDYLLRLVVTDNLGEALPPCVIQVRLNNPVQQASP